MYLLSAVNAHKRWGKLDLGGRWVSSERGPWWWGWFWHTQEALPHCVCRPNSLAPSTSFQTETVRRSFSPACHMTKRDAHPCYGSITHLQRIAKPIRVGICVFLPLLYHLSCHLWIWPIILTSLRLFIHNVSLEIMARCHTLFFSYLVIYSLQNVTFTERLEVFSMIQRQQSI